MYFMQKIEKKFIKTITGVEQEIINWIKRIEKNVKIRAKVKHIYNHNNRPDAAADESIQWTFLAKVGPILKAFFDSLRFDIDTTVNGGVLTTLQVFFPNEQVIQKLSDAAASGSSPAPRSAARANQRAPAEERFRLRLKLFVTIETWF